MANIKVNDGTWKSLSAEDQTQIIKIMEKTRLLEAGSSIVPDPNEPVPAQEFLDFGWCKFGCDAIQGAATTACALITGPAAPVAIAVCMAVAQAAGDACRGEC